MLVVIFFNVLIVKEITSGPSPQTSYLLMYESESFVSLQRGLRHDPFLTQCFYFPYALFSPKEDFFHGSDRSTKASDAQLFLSLFQISEQSFKAVIKMGIGNREGGKEMLTPNQIFFFTHFLTFKKNSHMSMFLLTSEIVREREKHQCEREISIGCLPNVPQLQTEPATQGTGTNPQPFSVCMLGVGGAILQQLSHPARAYLHISILN